RPVRGDVRLADVRFGHEDGHPVLDGLDLHVAPGESLALVGPTGSGKSTIAGLLARLYDPDAGAVLLDGHNVRDLRLSDVRQAVALVFEETFLFTDTVKENIRFARPDAGDEEIERAAALAGAAARRARTASCCARLAATERCSRWRPSLERDGAGLCERRLAANQALAAARARTLSRRRGGGDGVYADHAVRAGARPVCGGCR